MIKAIQVQVNIWEWSIYCDLSLVLMSLLFWTICDLSMSDIEFWDVISLLLWSGIICFLIYCTELISYDDCFLNTIFCFPVFFDAMSMRSVLNLFMIYWYCCNELTTWPIPILSQFWWMMMKLIDVVYKWYYCNKWMMLDL